MKQIVLTLGIALLTSVGFSQKNNLIQAAMAYQAFEQELSEQKNEEAVKEILEAKGAIDLALAHEDTKNDAKCLMYAGKIYVSTTIAYSLDSASFPGLDTEKTFNTGLDYLKKSKEVDSKGRYEDDVDDFAKRYRAFLANQGIAAYEDTKYEIAAAGLLGAAKFGEVLGIKDSVYLFFGGNAAIQIEEYESAVEAFEVCVDINYNTGESVRLLGDALVALGKKDEAEKVLKAAATKYPENLQLLINLTNFYIDEQRVEEAGEVISEAIKLDPTNIPLVYTSAIIYDGMGKSEDAEAAYKKTLELDPNHTDAKYSIGVFYYNQGADANNEANALDINSPEYEKLIAKKTEYFNMSVEWLVKADADKPNDRQILEALKNAYGKVGDVENFKAIKAKLATLPE